MMGGDTLYNISDGGPIARRVHPAISRVTLGVWWEEAMVNEQASDIDRGLWQHYVEAEHAFITARMRLFSHSAALLELVHSGLTDPTERAAALDVSALLSVGQKQQLFGDLLALASFGHGSVRKVRDLILSLPHDWLVANIEHYAEPLLEYDEHEEYRRLLESYRLIDRDLTLRLARRAAAHGDEDIREAGEDFLVALAAVA